VGEPAADDPGDPFAALGDPNRRRIVEILATGPRTVGDLAADMPISRPAVSRHLRLLREARLVVEERAGTRRVHHLDEAGAAVVEAYLREVWGEALARFRLVAENTVPRGAG
jgi:DNA-binding transcriptional ArsR family regulator